MAQHDNSTLSPPFCRCTAGLTVPCNFGFYNPTRGANLQTACLRCPANSMTNVSGASSISQCTCIDGFIATVVNGSQSCQCEAGYGLARTGSAERCLACIRGSYKPTRGNDRCTDCASDRTTVHEGATSLSACVCKLGLFDHNGTCRSCPQLGVDCSAIGVKVETFPLMEGYYNDRRPPSMLHT